MADFRHSYLEHTALLPDLDLADVLTRFWNETRPLTPVAEVHVVDPYALDSGKRDPKTHSDNLAALVKPLLKSVGTLTIVHGREKTGVREALQSALDLVLPVGAKIRFVRPSAFHHRWIVADRQRLALMDLSFNQIGQSLGGINIVTSEQDRAEYCAVLEAQDPRPSGGNGDPSDA